jgi:hypothetical protein
VRSWSVQRAAEDIVLRFFAPPTRAQRLVGSLSGVSRRRRLAAYASIAGGLVILRPMLVRIALVGLAVAVLVAR